MVLGSGIRDPEKTFSGSRIQGSKRHRIPDPDPQQCRKLSEFCSELIRREEKCLEFRSVEKKFKETLGILSRSMSWTKTCCLFCLLEHDFL
jgi:hypothetical protein